MAKAKVFIYVTCQPSACEDVLLLHKKREERCFVVSQYDAVALVAQESNETTEVICYLTSTGATQAIFGLPFIEALRTTRCEIRVTDFATALSDQNFGLWVHERCQPQTLADLVGGEKWLPRVFEHCAIVPDPSPDDKKSAEPTPASMLVVCGQSGVGKTCGIEHVLVNQLKKSGRNVTLFPMWPGDYNSEGGGAPKGKKKKKSTAAKADGESDLLDHLEPLVASASGLAAQAVKAIKEHMRKVHYKMLPPTALFLLVVNDLESIVGGAPASLIAGFAEIGATARRYPKNVALVATCSNWYADTKFMAALRAHKSTTIAYERLTVPLLQEDAIGKRLFKCFPTGLGGYQIQAISKAAAGNMCLALLMAEYDTRRPPVRPGEDDLARIERQQGAVATMQRDHFSESAIVMQTRTSIVSAAARLDAPPPRPQQKDAGKKLGLLGSKADSLFDMVQRRAATLSGVQQAVGNNWPSLVPVQAAGDTLTAKLANLKTLEAMADATDLFSIADIYDKSRRQSAYAGGDGVDTDQAIYVALANTAPCIRLAIGGSFRKAFVTPGTEHLEFSMRRDYTLMETQARTSDMLLDTMAIRVTRAHASPADAAVLLARDRANRETYSRKRFVSSRGGYDPMLLVELAYIGSTWSWQQMHAVGFDKQLATTIKAYSYSLVGCPQRMQDIVADYARTVKDSPLSFPKRLESFGATRRAEPKPPAQKTPAPPPTFVAPEQPKQTKPPVTLAQPKPKAQPRKRKAPTQTPATAQPAQQNAKKTKQTTLPFVKKGQKFVL